MGQRTTKAERRAARRDLPAGCRRWGTARCARLLRGDDSARWALQIALAVAVPPEVLIAGEGPILRGQYWPPTGEVLDAPHHPRLPPGLAAALAGICAELDRVILQPGFRRCGVDPEPYTVGFDLAGATLRAVSVPGPPLAYEPPAPVAAPHWQWHPDTGFTWDRTETEHTA